MPVTYLTPEEIERELEKREDLRGARFHRLIVVRAVAVWHGNQKKHTALVWRCRCDCGQMTDVKSWYLMSGTTGSCGCYGKDHGRIHGQWNTRGYWARLNMLHRCYLPSHPNFERWGGRGIKVCRSWRECPAAFLEDMGQPPPQHSLDRIDNNGHYSCGKCDECIANGWTKNCRWATQEEQCDNRENTTRLTINGITKSLRMWAKESGVKPATIEGRLRYGNWTPEEAVFTRPYDRPRTRRVYNPRLD